MPKLLFQFSLIISLVVLVACGGEAEPTAVLEEPTPAATSTPTAVPPTITPPPTATAVAAPPTPTAPVVEEETAATETENTAALEPSPSPEPSPTETPDPLALLNGVPVDQIVVLPDETIAHMKTVFAEGQARGRDPHRFSKLGDSVIANGDFLTRFDAAGAYTLGPYDYLQPTIDYYPGSWDRYGVGIRIGLSAWGVFDPMWADKEWCEPNEAMIDCEFRLNNPSVVIIHLGTNDTNESFEKFLRQTVQHSLDNGVIPILLTKADRYESYLYEEENRNNNIIRQVAADFKIPLVDFDIVADTLPNRGLKDDNIHLNGPLQHDYNLEEAYTKGHTVHNLAVLLMMERIREEVIGN
ncbi:MAG: SGNH/GDSL hydrolase family protein [Anaerolineales bacterium]|nr:SGNH/GDSL hydrolase family protein [Anaerolineales bacterium]